MRRPGWRRQAALDGYVAAQGLIRGLTAGRHLKSLRPEFHEALEKIERGHGALIEASGQHDEGAYARCAYCGRYTANAFALVDTRSESLLERAESLMERARCDCGEVDGWSGSFEPPGEDARWSIGLEVKP